MATALVIDNNYSCLKSEDGHVLDTLWRLLRFRERNYFHSRLYKQKKWDGFRDFFSRKTGKFLTGLLPEVRLALREMKVEYEVQDNRKPFEFLYDSIDENFLNYGPEPITLYDYQVELVNKVLKYKRGILFAPTGCHRKGQGILMFDGSIKRVEDIKVGDRLMGIDSTPRTVLQLCRGVDQMFEVVPKRGKPFVVNGDHLLTVTRTRSHNNRYIGELGGELVEIKTKDWMSMSKWQKHLMKLKKSDCIKFKTSRKLPIDPYLVGLLIGDGHLTSTPKVTTSDIEIKEELDKQAIVWNVDVKNDNWSRTDRCPTYALVRKQGSSKSNPLMKHIRRLCLNVLGDSKFIPFAYKTASVKSRRKLLAGLLDSDGNHSKHYEYSSQSKQLADDVAFLVRSLGLYANVSAAVKSCQTGVSGLYYRVYISGDLTKIPTKLPRKQCCNFSMRNDPLRIGFAVKSLNVKEEYYGFILDGDQRYLLDDFTITHNSGKTNTMVAIVKCLPPKTPTLIMGNKKSLVDQNYEELVKWGIPNVGRLYDAIQEPNYITCCTVQSAHKLEKLLPKIKACIIDEVHEMMSAQPMAIYRKLTEATVRVAASATVYKFDGKDEVQKYRTKGWIGSPLKLDSTPDGKLTTKFLQERQTLSKSKCTFYTIREPQLPYAIYEDAITHGMAESKYLNETVARLVKTLKGRTLILVERIAHGDLLESLIPNSLWIKGEDDMKTRAEVIEYLKSYKNKVVGIATSGILNTGINVKVHNLINCAGGKADHQIAQRIGRGLRTASDKEGLNYYDFIFDINPYLKSHSEKRIKILKKLGHEIIIKDEIDF
jgi:superfamily II DNA or RNA helicase